MDIPSGNRLCLYLLLGSHMSNHLIWAIVTIHHVSQIRVHLPRLESVGCIELVALTLSGITSPYSLVSNIVVCSSLVYALKSLNCTMFPSVANFIISSYNGRYGDYPRVANLE